MKYLGIIGSVVLLALAATILNSTVAMPHELRGTPKAVHLDRAEHDAACDKAYDVHSVEAADVCLLAADEWSHLAAKHSLEAEAPYYELMRAFCREQMGFSAKLLHHDAVAFDQIILGASIAISVGKRTHDSYFITLANAIIKAAVKEYPSAFVKVP